jgi:hypothetical protein
MTIKVNIMLGYVIVNTVLQILYHALPPAVCIIGLTASPHNPLRNIRRYVYSQYSLVLVTCVSTMLAWLFLLSGCSYTIVYVIWNYGSIALH